LFVCLGEATLPLSDLMSHCRCGGKLPLKAVGKDGGAGGELYRYDDDLDDNNSNGDEDDDFFVDESRNDDEDDSNDDDHDDHDTDDDPKFKLYNYNLSKGQS